MNFTAIPGRDAHATFAGLVFQVNVTILRWLNLRQDQLLELEAGEDIDLIHKAATNPGSVDNRILEQVKQLKQRSLTLKHRDALEAIANFCAHRRANSGANLSFRFLTTTSVGKERGWGETSTGIETWEKLRTRKLKGAEQEKAVEKIHAFLVGCRRPTTVSKTSWGCLRGILSQPGREELTNIIAAFEWATESGDHVEIESEVVALLERSDPPRPADIAKRIYQSLFAFVLRLLSASGTKQLTSEMLAAEIKSSTSSQGDLLAAARLREWIDQVDAILDRHEKDIQELKERIPAPRSPTFYEPGSSFERSGKTGALFDFSQTLRGRRGTLADLDSFLQDPTKRIAIFSGRGGIGKTKVLRDWSRARDQWKVLWGSPHGVWHDGTAGEIPAQDTVIIADDAHHYGDLNKLISLVSSQAGEPQLKMIISTRPSGLAYVNELLARIADENSIIRYKTLRALSKTATVEIAKEMLGSEYEHLAERLAEVSKDTPLITVVGGRLIARGQITPDLLANDKEFRQIVFTKFGEECSGQLPSGGRSKSELLELISAVQPVDDQAEDFVTRASVFLSLRPDQIRRGMNSLEQTEVLIRGGGKLRIVPDLFADYLLETSSIDSHGRTNGFAEAVFRDFEETHLPNLLKNFAELDWRITQSGKESRLLDNIWSSILTRFRQQDAADRHDFLRMADDIVVFQPANVQNLIQIAMDAPVPPVKKWRTIRFTQEDILTQLSPLLEVTIVNEKTSIDAFDRLWVLAQHESEEVSGAAQRALKEVISYRKYKHVIFNERILALVEKRAADISSYKGRFTPLDLMDELLDREVDVNELKGRAFSISALPVNYEVIKGLRERAFKVINQALYAAEPRIGVRAARSLGSVVAEFHPKFRSGASGNEREWQDAERLRALELLQKRLQVGNISLPLLWKVHRILRRSGKRTAQSAVVRDRAAAIQVELPRLQLFDMFNVLCTNEYEDNTEAEGYALPSSIRRAQQDSAITMLREQFTKIYDQIQAVEELLRQAGDASIDPKSVDPVLSQLCQQTAFLEGFSEFVLAHQESILASVCGVAIREWRSKNLAEYSRYGCLFAASANAWMARSTAFAVSYGPPLNDPVREDVDILAVLAKRREPYALVPVFFGLKRLTKAEVFQASALALIGNVEIGNHHNLAAEYCNIFGPYGISPTVLDVTVVEKILGNLVAVEELDREAFGSFVASVCGIAPLALVSFFAARIHHAQLLEESGEDTDYEPIPSSFSWSSCNAIRNHPEYQATLRSVIDVMKRYPQHDYYLRSIFWYIARPDVTTFSVLDELLHTSNQDDAVFLINLLGEAPRGLTLDHPMFALHILTQCADQSEELERAAMARLVGNCFSGGGFQQVSAGTHTLGNSNSSDTIKTVAAKFLADSQPGSLAFRLYTEIINAQRPSLPPPEFANLLGESENFEEE